MSQSWAPCLILLTHSLSGHIRVRILHLPLVFLGAPHLDARPTHVLTYCYGLQNGVCRPGRGL